MNWNYQIFTPHESVTGRYEGCYFNFRAWLKLRYPDWHTLAIWADEHTNPLEN